MPIPTINDVQGVEQILTNVLIGYMQADTRFAALRQFPAIPVEKDSGTYYIVTKKYFFMDDLRARAPGGDFEYAGFGVETDTYSTFQWGKGLILPDEVKANSQLPMDLEQIGLMQLAQKSLIRKEVQFAADFMINSVWGTTDNNATTDWDDFSAGDPQNDVLTAVRTISNNTGQLANTMLVGAIVEQALKLHPSIIDLLKYTQVATPDAVMNALAPLLGLSQILVSRATYTNTNEAAAFSATAIIDDDALITHTNPGAGIFGVTAGKTFVWNPGGGEGAIFRDPPRRNHSDTFQHKEQWDQKATATDCGYLFLDVV